MNPSDYILFNDVEDRPDGTLYRIMDTMAVEREIAYFLYGLVLLIKPKLILESGTGSGLSSAFMACALRDNGFGKLITFEVDGARIETLKKKLAGLPLEVVHGDLLSYSGTETPDFVFLDSDSNYRPAEVARYVRENVSLAIHDANRYRDIEGGTYVQTYRGFWFRIVGGLWTA